MPSFLFFFLIKMGQTCETRMWAARKSSSTGPTCSHWCAAYRRLVCVQPCSPHCFRRLPCQSDKLYFWSLCESALTHGMSLGATVDMSKEYLGVEGRFRKRQSYSTPLKTVYMCIYTERERENECVQMTTSHFLSWILNLKFHNMIFIGSGFL